MVARRAHNPKVAGSKPVPATMAMTEETPKTDALIEIQGRMEVQMAEIERLEALPETTDETLDTEYEKLGAMLDEFYDPAKWARAEPS